MKLEHSLTNYKKTKLTSQFEDRVGEIQRASLKKTLLKEELDLEKAKKDKFLKDVQSTYSLQETSICNLKEVKENIKVEQIMAIKCWKHRFLTSECKQYSCGLVLTILKMCHKEHIQAGYEQIELVEFTSARITHAIGLSYEQIKDLANKDDKEAPNDLLDANSKEKVEDSEGEAMEEEKEESNEVLSFVKKRRRVRGGASASSG